MKKKCEREEPCNIFFELASVKHMAESKLAVASLAIGILALVAVIAFGLYFLLRKQPQSASQSSSSRPSALVVDSTQRSLLSMFPTVDRCDASNPCSAANESSLCLPGSPGNPSSNELVQCYNNGSSFAWTGITQIPNTEAAYPANGPLFLTNLASHGNAIAALGG